MLGRQWPSVIIAGRNGSTAEGIRAARNRVVVLPDYKAAGPTTAKSQSCTRRALRPLQVQARTQCRAAPQKPLELRRASPKAPTQAFIWLSVIKCRGRDSLSNAPARGSRLATSDTATIVTAESIRELQSRTSVCSRDIVDGFSLAAKGPQAESHQITA